ncbi:MAG: hypothetical protein IT347_00760 [Candidatus Eisenbacteria bacterium]|nr:hypothetical protein [Candidatus Eisenbacteria bacterium]
MSLPPVVPAEAAAPSRPISPLARALAIFANPGGAWGGLEERSRWWIPVLVIALINIVVMLPLYQRAYLPMYFDQLDSQLASGAIDAAQAAQAEKIMQWPGMGPIVAGVTGLISVLLTLLMALAAWFGVGFLLGAKFRYRLALEVTAWSGLVWIPQHIAFFLMAWSQETMKGIHFGLAAFLPAMDPPSKLHAAASVLLDTVGPFNIWFLVVAVLGASALSGAPRRSVAWVLVGLAVVIAVIIALITGWSTPAI